MDCLKFILVLLVLIQFSTPSICYYMYHYDYSDFTIITSMKWTVGESNQVCVNLPWSATSEEELKISVRSNFGEFLLDPTSLTIPEGETSICNEYFISETLSGFGILNIEGVLDGEELNTTKTILVIKKPVNLIIQTDKDSYSPGQTLNFRILTLEGYSLNASTEVYEKIWIESPSNVVLTEWSLIQNDEGLVHMSTELEEEIEEGTYYIRVKYANQKIFSQSVEVNKYFASSQIEISFRHEPFWHKGDVRTDVEVCARYKFGKPYTGTLDFKVYAEGTRIVEPPNAGGISRDRAEVLAERAFSNHLIRCTGKCLSKIMLEVNNERHSRRFEISGCKNVTLYINSQRISKRLRIESSFDANNYIAETFFTEIVILDRAITFKTNSDKHFKPELPATVTIVAQFTDDIPASNELIEICAEEENICKEVKTDADGSLKIAIPPHLSSHLVVKAMNYKDVRNLASIYHFQLNRSNSFLHYAYFDIANDIPNVNCDASSEDIQFDVPIRYSTFKYNITEINVQVVSRGQIHFNKVFERDLSIDSPLNLDEFVFLAPMESKMGLSRGSFNISVTLPKTATTNAKLIVWYRGKHGTFEGDSQVLNIAKCPFQNAVHVSWRSQTYQPGETATLSLKAAPNSICSISVVEKSVRPTNTLSISTLLERMEKSTVHQHEDAFANRIDDCDRYFDERMRHSYSTRYKYSTKLINDAGLYIITEEYALHYSLLCPANNQFMKVKPTFKWEHLNYDCTTVKSVNNVTIPVSNYVTWAWELVSIPDNGVLDFPLEVPEKLVEWQGSALCVHPTKGVGVSNVASTRVSKDYFAELRVRRYPFQLGNYMYVTINIFNNLEEPLPVRIVPETKNGTVVQYKFARSFIRNESTCLSQGEIWSTFYSTIPAMVGLHEVDFSVYFDVPVDGCKTSGRKPKKIELSTQVKVEL